MALVKDALSVNFAKGLDLKSDPWQVMAGNFLALENAIFTKGGLLQKRNGFMALPSLTNTALTLSTYADNLAAIGTNIQIFSADSQQWLNRGAIQNVSLSVLPVVRIANNIVNTDTAIASNGLAMTAYTDSMGHSFYQINDSASGQIIVSQTALPSTATAPRAFAMGPFLVVTFLATVSATPHLQYVAVPIQNPNSPGPVTDISTQVSSLSAGYDGATDSVNLYIAWNGSDGGGAIRITYIDSNLQQHNTDTIPGHTADRMSVTVDPNGVNSIIWVTFYNNTNHNAYTANYSISGFQLNQGLATTQTITNVVSPNLTSTAVAGLLTIFYETFNNYSGSVIRSDFLSSVTCSSLGVVSSPKVILRSVGLGSKSFFFPPTNTTYLLASYGGTFQPSYFLIDAVGNVISKLAYTNGVGYESYGQVLPLATVIGSSAQIGYLFQSQLVPVNKSQGATKTAAVYEIAGSNIVNFMINVSVSTTAEIAGALHLTGGFLWEYDGVKPVEHQFHLFPEDISVTTASPTESPTGTTVSGSNIINTVSSLTGIVLGQAISGTGIPSGSTITAFSGSTITISKNATASNAGVTLTITGNVSVAQLYYYYFTYEWTDAQGRLHRSAPSIPTPITTTGTTSQNTIIVPTLRLTYKTAPNQVRIVGYRWSTAQETPFQFTSILVPNLNDTTVDTITIVDAYSDADILGNPILYTFGGTVEDTAAPACALSTLYKSRLFVVDSEDPNLLWFSKQVIESVPVEFSDLFTIYVAPTIGAQGSTGQITALSAMDDKLIIFKNNAIYYITGIGPDNAGANNDFSDPIFVTATVGCTNPQSIVFMPSGLMFQSDKGIWLLGRDLSTTYIGAPVETFNSSTILSALNIPATNQVRFTVNNGITLMYDYYFNQWGTFNGVPATSSVVYQGLHAYVNSFGQVFQEKPGSYMDGSTPVLLSFTTGWMNLASLQGYERFYYFFILGKYLTPHKLSVGIAYDYEPSPAQIIEIQPDNFSPAWGGNPLWGSGTPWGGPSFVEQWRVDPIQQKCTAFQISITEQYDNTLGVAAGAGLTMSGLNLVVGLKKKYRPQNAANQAGGNAN